MKPSTLPATLCSLTALALASAAAVVAAGHDAGEAAHEQALACVPDERIAAPAPQPINPPHPDDIKATAHATAAGLREAVHGSCAYGHAQEARATAAALQERVADYVEYANEKATGTLDSIGIVVATPDPATS
jgi:hypothetical protein